MALSSFQVAGQSLLATGDINPARFVSLNGNWTCEQTRSGHVVFGVSQNFPKGFNATLAAQANDPVGVYTNGQECWITLGATLIAGQEVKSDGSGQAVAASGSDPSGAILLEGGSSGQIVRCRVEIGEGIGS